MKWNVIRIAAVAACTLGSAAASAQSVEVMHWWTSGGEGAAIGVLKKDLESRGIQWIDMAVSGGGGEAAMTALRARAVAGNPPTSAQFLGMAVVDWANEDFLSDLTEVATKENWDRSIPPALQRFAKFKGKYVAVPVNIHRPHWLWMNARIFNDNGLRPPTTWDEFNATADKLKAKGILPLAMGGQPFQEATAWESVVLGLGGPDFYRKAVIEADPASMKSATMLKVFDQMRKLRGYVDRNFAGRDWNLATSMVIKGDAAMQLMGDWVKGELIAAKGTPGKEVLCIVAPGTQGSFLFNTDFFAMFKVGGDRRAMQLTMASAVMNPTFQETFNLAKGSIPARSDVPMDKFDACGKQSAADLKAATAANHVYGSLAHGHAQPAAMQRAYLDVITKHFNSDMSSKDAVEALAKAVVAAR
ncbi:carbohydrate ABC transporter substrate-binding protein [Verminephrobacter aporrectodeae subsp. tuberculatae]|uniref:Probable sugar-binding periplasmic protein n=1 Tax=Verminephrobacter aporrectodeae subsp. tuberculatae TaxID=1110392 RepID=A0ABT3KP10_9BURK|nr:ABC transporter substrate-binding protein [Verminephrobacter aporrectodeae]MCW5320067.1 carbohydrate ABC transporter substrate-binding protein [Verminephrobacter aporrectodeae subsp. tuberculatae]MCW8207720.1 carbohydrate ABC transporter substrate-binding protein [Verminephrobacter aporrectodeae subsp. tuberculatae]